MNSKKILVVEDNAEMRHLLRTLLETEGHEVVECETAQSARLRLALDLSFSLLILDVGLEDGSGFDLAQSLVGRDHRFRICFVTGKRTIDDVKRAAEVGAADYIVKPINPFQFLEKVRKILAPKDAAESPESKAVATNVPAQILGLPIELNVRITSVSTQQINLISSVYVKPGTQIKLLAKCLSAQEADGGLVSVEVIQCSGSSGDFEVRTRIVLLSKDQRQLIDSHIANGTAFAAA